MRDGFLVPFDLFNSYPLKLKSTHEQPNWAYELIRHLSRYLHIPPPSVECLKPSHSQQNLVEVKEDGCSQINLGKETCITLQRMVNRFLFILFPGLFSTIAQSAKRSAKHFFEYIHEGCQEKGAFRFFVYFGVLSSSKKGNNLAY